MADLFNCMHVLKYVKILFEKLAHFFGVLEKEKFTNLPKLLFYGGIDFCAVRRGVACWTGYGLHFRHNKQEARCGDTWVRTHCSVLGECRHTII